MIDLFGFLYREGALAHPRLLPLSVLSGASRGVIIMLVNLALTGGLSLATAAWIAVPVLLVHLASAHFARVSAQNLVETMQRDLRLSLLTRMLRVDARFFLDQDKGEIYNALTVNIAQLALSAMRLLNGIQSIVLVVFCFGYFFWLSLLGGAAAVTALALGAVASSFSDRIAKRNLAEAHRHTSDVFARADDVVRGFKEVRLNSGRQAALRDDIAHSLDEARRYSIAAERAFSYNTIASHAVLFLFLALIAFVVPQVGLADQSTSLQLVTVALFAHPSMETLLSNYPSMARARLNLERLRALEADLSETVPAVPAVAPERPFDGFREIILESASLTLAEPARADALTALPRESFTLGPIDFTIRRGEIVFLRGGNGSGKTTMLAMLAGLRQPDWGRVAVDGHAVETADAVAYRNLFSGVFSDFHLFPRTYGLSDEQAARAAELLEELDLGRRTGIDRDRFTSLSLSAGQRRRLALAIALAEGRPVLLLDEFAADQDPWHRAWFYERLLPRLRAEGRTVIATTHDETRFSLCDRLVEMESGRIVSVSAGSYVRDASMVRS